MNNSIEKYSSSRSPSMIILILSVFPLVAPMAYPMLKPFAETYFLNFLAIIFSALPLVCFGYVIVSFDEQKTFENDSNMIMFVLKFIFSVIYIVLTNYLMYKPISMSLMVASTWRRDRKDALGAAKKELSKGIDNRRIIRKKQYDLYLPPTPPSSGSDSTTDNCRKVPGLLFLPGALVEHSAYARVASGIADRGIVVVVVNFEPTRAAARHLGATCVRMRRIINDVKSTISKQGNNSCIVEEWSVGGHSMGGVAVVNLLIDGMLNEVKKLILWGVYGMYGNDLSKLKKRLDVLTISASNDGLLFLRESKEQFRSKLPKDTSTHVMIEGGNHCGFADYSNCSCSKDEKQAQPGGFIVSDLLRTIPIEDQHKQTINSTAEFLLESKSKQE